MCHTRGFAIIHNVLVAAGIFLQELWSEGTLTKSMPLVQGITAKGQEHSFTP